MGQNQLHDSQLQQQEIAPCRKLPFAFLVTHTHPPANIQQDDQHIRLVVLHVNCETGDNSCKKKKYYHPDHFHTVCSVAFIVIQSSD